VNSVRKGSIILLNKWDLIDKEKVSIEKTEKDIYRKLWFMRYAPVLTISALNRQRVTKVFKMIDRVIAESSKRISTHELNEFLRAAVARKEPPLYQKGRVKIYYITQVKTNPPGFTIFTNKKAGIKEQYVRYLEGQLRERFGFQGTPVDFYVRQKKQR
ncbi:MAG: ribosome biogenesis GTPase Der, partial [Nitrospiraceae bacterium]